MKQKSYLITNRGSSTISVVGRREFTIPKGCKDMEFSVPDTKEMKERMARLKRKYPALKIVAVAEPIIEPTEEPAEAQPEAESVVEPSEEQKAATTKKSKAKKAEQVEAAATADEVKAETVEAVAETKVEAPAEETSDSDDNGDKATSDGA